MPTLPTPGGDAGTWGTELNEWLTLATVTTRSGTSETLALADNATIVEFTNASAVTLTVPTNASVAFAVGSYIQIVQYGAGQVTIAPAGGVTLNAPGARLKIAEQYGGALLRKRATNEWMVDGSLSA